jgi:hypothetical protein
MVKSKVEQLKHLATSPGNFLLFYPISQTKQMVCKWNGHGSIQEDLKYLDLQCAVG